MRSSSSRLQRAVIPALVPLYGGGKLGFKGNPHLE